jgi:hypothetical protein
VNDMEFEDQRIDASAANANPQDTTDGARMAAAAMNRQRRRSARGSRQSQRHPTPSDDSQQQTSVDGMYPNICLDS